MADALTCDSVVLVRPDRTHHLAPNGMRNMTIGPGLVRTPMLLTMPQAVQDALVAGVPVPRHLGTLADCVNLVEHIIENDMLNGEVIRLDGAIQSAPN